MARPSPTRSPTSAGTRAGPPPSCRSTRRAGGRPGSWPPTATPGCIATPDRRSRCRDRRPPAPRGGGCRRPAGRRRLGRRGRPRRRDTAVIQAVLPRRTAFGRNTSADGYAGNLAGEQVLAANVDVALVITSLDGDFNLRRLERYLAVAWTGGATPVIVLNKADVADDPEGLRIAAEAVAPGVEVRIISALTGDGVADLADDHLPPGRTAVVLGSSGVGKSTLVNALLGHDRQRTGDVREDDSRGRHTTTHRELVRLPAGALLIDTPGIRSLGVAGADRRPRDHLRRHRRARRRLQVPGLPPRRRARLQRPRGARRRPPRSGAARQPSQARARGGARRACVRPDRPCGGTASLEDHLGLRGRAHAAQVRERPMTTHDSLRLPEAPAASGITYRRFAGPRGHRRAWARPTLGCAPTPGSSSRSTSSHAPPLHAPRELGPARRLPRRRARRADGRLRAGRVARPRRRRPGLRHDGARRAGRLGPRHRRGPGRLGRATLPGGRRRATRPTGGRWFANFSFDGDTEVEAALLDRGYAPVRWDAEMLRPDLDDLPEASRCPRATRSASRPRPSCPRCSR